MLLVLLLVGLAVSACGSSHTSIGQSAPVATATVADTTRLPSTGTAAAPAPSSTAPTRDGSPTPSDRSGLDQAGYARLERFIDRSRSKRAALGLQLSGRCASELTSRQALPAFGRCVSRATRGWRADFDRSTAASAVPLRRRATGGCLDRWHGYDGRLASYEDELDSLHPLAVPASASQLTPALGAYVRVESALCDAEEEVYAACTPDS